LDQLQEVYSLLGSILILVIDNEFNLVHYASCSILKLTEKTFSHGKLNQFRKTPLTMN